MTMQNIVIIGAGPAGLTAAYELLKLGANIRVTVLEESGEIGGISKTVRYKGNRMDIGGHRFFSKDEGVLDWWLTMLPESDPTVNDNVFMTRDRVSRIFWGGKFFDYPISLSMQTIINMGFYQTLEMGFSYIAACLHKLPETSLENFYINRFGRALYKMFFESYTEKLWGRHPREISADWGAQRVKGISIKTALKDAVKKLFGKKKQAEESSLIESFLYPKFGPGQLWETAAERICELGGEIRLNSKVTHVSRDSVTVENGEIFPASVIISSMAIKDLIAAMENVPQEIRKIAENLPYRDFVTVGLLVDKLALHSKRVAANGLVPDCWIYVQDPGVKLGRIQIFNNWSPYMVADPTDTVWVGLEYFCSEGDEFWEMPDERAREFAVDEMKRIGAIDDERSVLDFTRCKVKKAYPAYFDSYAHIGIVINWLNSIPNLYCIGRNGQHRYNNMDHSMLMAFEVVRLIRGESDDKSKLWEINTESEYHESK
jgi:protoporphyrinogen oxidase